MSPNIRGYLRYRTLLLRTRPRRYANLFSTLYRNRCRSVVEIGTWDGIHGEQMIQTAALHHSVSDIDYFGFDLFEEMTDDALKGEFSKWPPAYADVRSRLGATGANIHLYKGNTRLTLPRAVDTIGKADLVFIDGGHSIETVTSDWNNVKQLMGIRTTVIFDDYYSNREAEVEGLGCQTLIDKLDSDTYEVEMLTPVDPFPKDWGVLNVNMVRVRKRHSDDIHSSSLLDLAGRDPSR